MFLVKLCSVFEGRSEHQSSAQRGNGRNGGKYTGTSVQMFVVEILFYFVAGIKS